MTVLTDMRTSELVVPVAPTTQYREVQFHGEGRWYANGLDGEFSSAFDAMMALRAEAGRMARHPVNVEILWHNVPRDFKPPTTGTAL